MKEQLSRIKVLWRQPDTLSLWGIPYDMRPGQSPYDLWRSTTIADTAAAACGRYGYRITTPGPRPGWLWLGRPGWWGGITGNEQDTLKLWLAVVADYIPGNACEFDAIPELIIVRGIAALGLESFPVNMRSVEAVLSLS